MIVLDTNALMMPVECDVRVFEELQRLGFSDYVIPSAVEAELEKLADGAGEEAVAASVGLDLADRCAVRETAADYADDAVLELATGTDVSHAVTNDQPLRDRLLDRGVPVIGLRGQNKLATTQP
ncbi:twitching motility protein PilT [Halomicrobium urmianum]|uniref:twitching motility protein PilT n=1 Tax=Halomicrobium urmianum TaxID=1586233 RepID=UPI001CD9D97E|nr:twitching motility protein PilT [Halomicrobium urmianum]